MTLGLAGKARTLRQERRRWETEGKGSSRPSVSAPGKDQWGVHSCFRARPGVPCWGERAQREGCFCVLLFTKAGGCALTAAATGR